MKIALTVALVLALVLVAGAAYFRLAPSDPARWHIDPRTAADPGPTGDLRRLRFDVAPDAAMAAFDAVALSEPRVVRLAGSPTEGHVTYVARSRVFGFPDYITVQAVADGAGSELVILSRLRFGGSDLGVNAARMDRWAQALSARLSS